MHNPAPYSYSPIMAYFKPNRVQIDKNGLIQHNYLSRLEKILAKTKLRTSPYEPERDSSVEYFLCLIIPGIVMLSMKDEGISRYFGWGFILTGVAGTIWCSKDYQSRR